MIDSRIRAKRKCENPNVDVPHVHILVAVSTFS